MKNSSKLRLFKSTDTKWKKYNGHLCIILKTITKPNKDYDAEVLPMHEIQFLDFEKKKTSCFPDELGSLASGRFKDEEVIGIDNDGCLLQWDKTKKKVYNCGETPMQFGKENITRKEHDRIGLCCHPAGPAISAMAEG